MQQAAEVMFLFGETTAAGNTRQMLFDALHIVMVIAKANQDAAIQVRGAHYDCHLTHYLISSPMFCI